MKLHIEPTSRVIEMGVEGNVALVPARVWEGETDNGVHVVCLITRVAASRDEDLSELEAVLAEQRQPSTHGLEAFPMRLIL